MRGRRDPRRRSGLSQTSLSLSAEGSVVEHTRPHSTVPPDRNGETGSPAPPAPAVQRASSEPLNATVSLAPSYVALDPHTEVRDEVLEEVAALLGGERLLEGRASPALELSSSLTELGAGARGRSDSLTLARLGGNPQYGERMERGSVSNPAELNQRLSLLAEHEHALRVRGTIRELDDAAVHDMLDLGEQIGEGATCSVYIGRMRRRDEEVAVKVIDRRLLDQNEKLLREIEILRRLDHPHIIHMRDVFATRDALYIVMELAYGEQLFDAICTRRTYNENDARRIMRQIVEAVAYMHARSVVHRDLKPENILFATADDDAAVKIVDFGLARICDQADGGGMSTPAGTLGFKAPELFEVGKYDTKVDMWAVGVITYILLCGFPPFLSRPEDASDAGELQGSPFWFLFNDDTPALRSSVIRGEVRFPDPFWQSISLTAKDFVRALLTKARERMSAEAALEHAWLSDVSARHAATAVLSHEDEEIAKQVGTIQLQHAISKLGMLVRKANSTPDLWGELPFFTDPELDVPVTPLKSASSARTAAASATVSPLGSAALVNAQMLHWRAAAAAAAAGAADSGAQADVTPQPPLRVLASSGDAAERDSRSSRQRRKSGKAARSLASSNGGGGGSSARSSARASSASSSAGGGGQQRVSLGSRGSQYDERDAMRVGDTSMLLAQLSGNANAIYSGETRRSSKRRTSRAVGKSVSERQPDTGAPLVASLSADSPEARRLKDVLEYFEDADEPGGAHVDTPAPRRSVSRTSAARKSKKR